MKSASKNKNYKQAVDILTSQGKFHINLGLERIEQALDLMGNPQKSLKFIHVAGTNGKGSVCAMLSAILKEIPALAPPAFESTFPLKGDNPEHENINSKNREPNLKYSSSFAHFKSTPSPLEGFQLSPSPLERARPSTLKVGLFTSPHVFDYTERIKINNIDIKKEIFAQKIITVIKLAEKNNIHLTEFEILTAVAFEYFAQNNVDIVVLETGLGGRLDATNVIETNLCSIITNIDFDHTERLGDTIEKIACEKAGIIKSNCPVIISQNNLGFKVAEKIAKEKKAEVISVSANEGPIFLQEKSAPKGTYQKENLALVLKVIEVLRKQGFEISQGAIETGLKNVKNPCRFEYLEKENILIDAAHNPNGTKSLRESLDYYFPNRKFKFIFGCLKNKNYAEMMQSLFTQKDEIYFYHFNNDSSCTYEDLSGKCEFSSKPFSEFKMDNNILTVICGSFYMIKELLGKIGIK